MKYGLTSALSALIFYGMATSVKADKVDDYLRNEMQSNHIPSLSIAIVRQGKVEKLKSYGIANLEWHAIATPDTAYQLASANKALTGTALMLLVQDGKIALDDSIRKYLPEAPPAWQNITIRHLATHSSGVQGVTPARQVNTVEEYVGLLYGLPLAYAPGEKSIYGAGYPLLSRIIERVTGESYPAFMRDRLFAPLGMNATTFDNATETGPSRSRDLVVQRSGIYRWQQKSQQIADFLYNIPNYSAGGLYSTASDLAKWAAALDSGKLLTPESLADMWTPQKLNDGTQSSYGVGWVVRTYRGHRTAGHSGGPALADVLRFVDTKLTIIILQNQQRLYPYLAQGVADILLPQIQQPPTKAIEDIAPGTTLRLRTLLMDLAAGQVDATEFAGPDKAELVSDLQDLVVPYLRSLEPLHTFALVEDSIQGEGHRRQYQAYFGKKPLLWTFGLDHEGKVIDINFESP
jgi:CubicO group peptidase (beta-lactamase class C family)